MSHKLHQRNPDGEIVTKGRLDDTCVKRLRFLLCQKSGKIEKERQVFDDLEAKIYLICSPKSNQLHFRTARNFHNLRLAF